MKNLCGMNHIAGISMPPPGMAVVQAEAQQDENISDYSGIVRSELRRQVSLLSQFLTINEYISSWSLDYHRNKVGCDLPAVR